MNAFSPEGDEAEEMGPGFTQKKIHLVIEAIQLLNCE